MSALVEFARDELQRAGLFDADSDYGGMLGNAVLKMIEQFAEEDHSGASAAMAIALFSKLAAFEPITPLSGEDDEWIEIEAGVFQNKRCPRVFKKNGQAYDIDGRVFRDPNGMTYTSHESRVPVTFPYSPRTEYVDVPG